MCGEHQRGVRDPRTALGSSPHVRGARLERDENPSGSGIIPACAGSTGFLRRTRARRRDHPRMCGEHQRFDDGEIYTAGSSPHVRGALRLFRFPLDLTGIIPACAGSTIRLAGRSMCSRDHPRMCGEHQRGVRDPRTALGSSPHVRGARLERDENPSGSGIIPACAGSTDRVGAAGSLVGDHPRMCGEHITPNPFANAVLGSSPHVRGALIQGIVLHCPLGIIPACAGSTARDTSKIAVFRDHPRMCGEHFRYD